MHQHQRRVAAVAALAVAVAAGLAACGSGSGGDNNAGNGTGTTGPTSDIPLSAQRDTPGLIAYVTSLLGMTSETSEPILVGDAVLPVDDHAEPSP